MVRVLITGGGAPKRYYIPLLHQHFSKPLVEAIVMANPTLLCNCEVCEKIKSKQKSMRIEKRINEFFTNIDYFLEAKNHFIKIHWQEFQEISKAESKETMKILDENLKQLEKCTLRDFGVTINYLKIWKKILEQFSSTNK